MKVIKKIIILSIILLSPLAIHTTSVLGINYDKIEENLNKTYEKNGINYIKNISKTIDKISNKKNLRKEKKKILEKLRKILKKIEKKEEKKSISLVKKEKNNIKNISNTKINNFRKNFYNKYGKNITTKKPLSNLCFKKYDLIDRIAKKNNFPTELIIATWKMEHSCIFANPSNLNGNFQIITRVYKPGKITDKQFEQQIQDFINFSKNKWKFYEKYKKLKSGTIKLKYNDFDFISIKYHGAAYNGVFNDLYTSKYINGNLNSKVPYIKDGLTTIFLKIIDWEIKNKSKNNNFSNSNFISKQKNPKKILANKEFDKLTFTKNGKNNFTIIGTTNGKLKNIKVLWLNGGKNEEYYKLQNYKFGEGFFVYNLKEKYKNIEKGLNKYKFIGENKYGKKFEKILEIKN